MSAVWSHYAGCRPSTRRSRSDDGGFLTPFIHLSDEKEEHAKMHRRIVAGCLTVLFAFQTAVADEVFPDEHLRQAIREILKRKQIDKEEIDPADLKTVYFLDARNRDIEDLAGLEHCINLAEVKLSDNRIDDLSPLAELKNIQSLYLSRNRIEDLRPLGNLAKLQYLEAENNKIASLAGLEALENLRALYISGNKISDLSPLSSLKKLTSLDLNGNDVEDITAVAELPWLSTLGLNGNNVADLSPLTGLTELHYTFLEGNPLEDLTPLVEMARKDVEGPKRFAPFWFLYLDVERLPEAAQKQVEELQQFGVRINRR